MENSEISMLDVLIETHAGLERQGPGSPEMTLHALSFINNLNGISKVADFGCGTGGQTMLLAQNIAGTIIGVDQLPGFIEALNEQARKLNLHDRVSGIVGSMESLSFQREEFDLIWSEGAIDSIGFEAGLTHWNQFLKKDGYIAVSCPSWLAEEHPVEVEKFWADAGSTLDAVGHNIEVMQKSGYSFIAAFMLPEKCWTENYFSPRGAAEKSILQKFLGNKTVEDYVESSKYEVELYSKFNKHYGYVFYIGKKA